MRFILPTEVAIYFILSGAGWLSFEIQSDSTSTKEAEEDGEGGDSEDGR